MADYSKLTTPTLHVVPPDGEPYDVQALNPDLVAYDITAFKHKWPPMTKGPLVFINFLAWHASRRTGIISRDLTYEAFRDTMLEVSAVGDAEGDAVPPSPTAPEEDF